MPRKRLFPPRDPQTNQPLQSKGRTPHTILTLNERVTLRRKRWSSPSSGSRTPLDAAFDAAEATISLGVRELACRLNQASHNFEKAAENLARAAQVRLSGETLRQVVEAEGRAVLKAQRAGTLPIGWSAAACEIPEPPAAPPPQGAAAAPPPQGAAAAPPPQGAAAAPPRPTRVYLGADGVKLPLVTAAEKQKRRQAIKQKRRRRGRKCHPLPPAKAGADQRYKEFKIVTYYDESQEHRHVSVTKGDHREAGRIMRRDAGRIGLNQADDKVAIVDGADWIRNQIQGQSLPLDAVGLDFYHLAENVHKARRVVYGEDDGSGQTWAAEVLHTVKHTGFEAFRERLAEWKGSWSEPRKQEAAEQLFNYVTDRRSMIAYPEFLALGRQIGSGPTESMCKATTQRLKGVGMRWDAANAEALMALDALDQSGAWKLYWAQCLKRAG